MGQKIHPVGFRLAVSRKYKSSWFAAKNGLFADLLNKDISVRQYLEEELNKRKKHRLVVLKSNARRKVRA